MLLMCGDTSSSFDSCSQLHFWKVQSLLIGTLAHLEGGVVSSTLGRRDRPSQKLREYCPSHRGYRPSHGGYRPSHRGYRPSHGGYCPSHRGNCPSHRGYRPSHRGYRPSHGRNCPSHRGYRPSHRGYRPSHRGNCPSHRGYRPTEGIVPPTLRQRRHTTHTLVLLHSQRVIFRGLL